MITISVPARNVAEALGEVPADVEIVVWDPAESDPDPALAARLDMACLAHQTGGRTVYGRLGMCERLRVIQIPSAGFEHAAPFVPDGVALANARGVHDTRVAEMTLALALASRRKLPQYLDAQRRGVWEQDPWTLSLADSRALVVGYGSIGEAIGARLRACEVEVEGVARSARIAPDGTTVHAVADLPALLPGFDLVIIVTPHDESTDKLVNADFLSAMPDGALLINVGRGKVVDTEALLVELEAGRLHAALDVTDPEPLPEGHPLWSAPNTIVVPHIAGFETLVNRRYSALVHEQIEALRTGREPVNVVMTGA